MNKFKKNFLSRENEANKRKLQQMQIKLDESQTKEQGTLAKLQECIQIVEQGQFEKNEVLISLPIVVFRINLSSFSQAIVERDQLKIELTETQKRLKKFLDEMNEKIRIERGTAEKIFEEKLKENAEKVNLNSLKMMFIVFLMSIRSNKQKKNVHNMN